MQNRSIAVSELEQVAQWQGLNLTSAFAMPGAWLVVRTGVTQAYRNLSLHEQELIPYRTDDYAFIGVETSDTTLRWMWEKKLSMVGSDSEFCTRYYQLHCRIHSNILI